MSPNGRFYNDVRLCMLDNICPILGQAMPFMITWGNHDEGLKNLVRSYFPENNGCYSFNYAGCHFLCIDWAVRNYEFIERDHARTPTARSSYS